MPALSINRIHATFASARQALGGFEMTTINDSAGGTQSAEALAGHLSEVLDTVEVAVYTKDLSGRYTWANGMALAVTGSALEDVIGKTDFQLLPPDLAKRFSEVDLQIIARQTERVCIENHVVMADGTHRVFENITKPLKDASGQLIGVVGTAADITVRKRLEEELRRQRLLLNTILDHVDAHIYMRDAEHRFHYVNRTSAALFGKMPDDIIGKCDSELMDAETAERIQSLDREVFRTGEAQCAQDTFVSEDGRTRYFWTVKVPFDQGTNLTPMLIGISTDITELHEAHEKMRVLSLTDPLTLLRNRRDFDEQMGRELSRARRSHRPTALLLIDLDHFKSVNDRFGHLVGDQVLVKVAELIHSMIRREDIAGRLGGEEFGVLMPGVDRASAMSAAERLRIAAAETQHVSLEGEPLRVTMSIGVAVCHAGSMTSREFFSQADRALYQAKDAGRNCFKG